MNIAVFTDTYKPEINGVITSIEIFRRQLESKGHTVYLFCPSYFGRETVAENVYRFPSTPYLFKKMSERRFVFPSLKVFWKLRKMEIDVIHSQVPANTGVFAILLSRFRRIPHVHTYHTLFMEYRHYMPVPRPVAVWLIEEISRRYCGRCQRVISPSMRIRRELERYGVNAPIDVIPTGIDIDPNRKITPESTIRTRHGIPKDRKLLLFVGRIGREKNISFLLRVMKMLAARRNDLCLMVVGDGPDRKRHLRELSSLKLELNKDIVFTGYVKRDEVFSYFKAAEVFTFASLTETQGLVLLEAMSMGTPVVAIDAMGVSDLLADGRGGILCSLNEEEFAAQVERLLDDRALYEQKVTEANLKAEEWSIERMAERLLESYSRARSDFRLNRHARFNKPRLHPPAPPLDPETEI